MTLDLGRRNRIVYRVMLVAFLIITMNQFMNLALYELGVVRETVHENYFLHFTLIPFLTNAAIMLVTTILYRVLHGSKPTICMYTLSISFLLFVNNVVMSHYGVQVVYSLYIVPIILTLVYNKKLLTYVIIVMAFALYMAVVFVYLPTLPQNMYHHTYMDLIATVGLFAGAFFICYAIFDSYFDLMVKAISLHDGYWGIKKHLTQVRQIKHEMKNNIAALKVLLDSGEYDKAKEFIATLTKQTSDTIDTAYCNNVLVNAILSNFKQTAMKSGIRTEISADVPEHINIKVQDLYSLVANILDNALEASEHVSDKFIKLEVVKNGLYMVISCVNGRAAGSDENCKTTKEDADEHGFGLLIISQIVNRYEGMCNLSHTENTFGITVAVKV